ncbi:MAG: XRE family transcriptional regulator [Pseudogulbenkiania sp.]|nr:XRE family transcriptional regulator [Pseudogulbenkiania sp.]
MAGRYIRATEVIERPSIWLLASGEQLAQVANEVLCRLADSMAGLRRRNNPQRLVISVIPSFAARWLMPRVGQFIEQHPQAELNISSSTDLVDMNRGEVDLAIRWGPGGYPGVQYERLMGDARFAAVSPSFNGGVMPSEPAQLADLPLLRIEGEGWVPWFRHAGLDWDEPVTGLKLSDSGMAIQAAIDGQGIVLARRSLASRAIRSGQLVRLFDVDSPTSWSYWLIRPEQQQETPLLQEFVSWLKQEMAADLAMPLRTG